MVFILTKLHSYQHQTYMLESQYLFNAARDLSLNLAEITSYLIWPTNAILTHYYPPDPAHLSTMHCRSPLHLPPGYNSDLPYTCHLLDQCSCIFIQYAPCLPPDPDPSSLVEINLDGPTDTVSCPALQISVYLSHCHPPDPPYALFIPVTWKALVIYHPIPSCSPPVPNPSEFLLVRVS
eukprot:12612763-Ditylum_brightwellii.AAC.1